MCMALYFTFNISFQKQSLLLLPLPYLSLSPSISHPQLHPQNTSFLLSNRPLFLLIRVYLFLFSFFISFLKLSFSHSLSLLKFLSLLPWRWQSYHLHSQKLTCTHPSSHSYRPVSPVFAVVLLDHSLEHEARQLSLVLLRQSKLLFQPHIFLLSEIIVSL